MSDSFWQAKLDDKQFKMGVFVFIDLRFAWSTSTTSLALLSNWNHRFYLARNTMSNRFHNPSNPCNKTIGPAVSPLELSLIATNRRLSKHDLRCHSFMMLDRVLLLLTIFSVTQNNTADIFARKPTHAIRPQTQNMGCSTSCAVNWHLLGGISTFFGN